MNEQDILFVENTESSVSDKPHCGDCRELVDVVVTDKPHCGDCE